MAIVVFEHHPLETAGRLGETLNQHGHRLEVVQLYRGADVPPDLDSIDGVVSMGGPMNTDEADQHAWMQPELDYLKAAHDAELPVVGVCLGAQLIATALGGEVGHMDRPEIGFAPVKSSFFGTVDPVLLGVPWELPMFHAHGCEVTKAPPGGTPLPLQSSAGCKVQSFRVGLNTYGFQYHFEWTRRTIDAVLDDDPTFYGSGEYDTDTIRESLDTHYDLYRHLGDRLCANLATLMFPLDKRLPPSGANVENYHAS
ncbi:MAG: type 1 glutamine amidotransferase [Planctomycetota bacterium]